MTYETEARHVMSDENTPDMFNGCRAGDETERFLAVGKLGGRGVIFLDCRSP